MNKNDLHQEDQLRKKESETRPSYIRPEPKFSPQIYPGGASADFRVPVLPMLPTLPARFTTYVPGLPSVRVSEFPPTVAPGELNSVIRCECPELVVAVSPGGECECAGVGAGMVRGDGVRLRGSGTNVGGTGNGSIFMTYVGLGLGFKSAVSRRTGYVAWRLV